MVARREDSKSGKALGLSERLETRTYTPRRGNGEGREESGHAASIDNEADEQVGS
jgi:hypothetical protein